MHVRMFLVLGVFPARIIGELGAERTASVLHRGGRLRCHGDPLRPDWRSGHCHQYLSLAFFIKYP